MAEIQQMIYVYTNIIKSLTNDGKEFKAQDVVDLYKERKQASFNKPFIFPTHAERFQRQRDERARFDKLEQEVAEIKRTLSFVLAGRPIQEVNQIKLFEFLNYVLENERLTDSQYRKFRTLKFNLKEFTKEDIVIADIDQNWIHKFNDFLLEKKMSKNSISLLFIKFKALNDMCKRIHKQFNSEIADYKVNSKGASEKKLIRDILNDDQVDQLFESKWDNPVTQESVNLFLFAFAIGAFRVGDILSLKWDEISNSYIYAEASKTRKISFVNFDNLTERRQKMIKQVLDYQRGFKKSVNQHIFFNLNNMKQVHDALSRHLKLVAKELKFKDESGTKINLTPNSVRHSFAYNVIVNNDLSVFELRDLFQHENVTTTEGYLKKLKSRIIQEKIRAKVTY